MSGLALAWMAEVGFMTYRITTRGRPPAAGGYRVPWPADYVASFVVFGSLSLMAEIGGRWQTVAAVTGWGFVLATVLNIVDPTNPIARPTAPGVKPGTTAATQAATAGTAPNPLAQGLGA